jgi:hypothetical protein
LHHHHQEPLVVALMWAALLDNKHLQVQVATHGQHLLACMQFLLFVLVVAVGLAMVVVVLVTKLATL